MLLHYLKVAVRNLLKYKTQSVISILGLAISFACVSLSIYWNHYEMTYDSFMENVDRIYRVRGTSFFSNSVSDVTPGPLCDYLKENYPEVENACAMRGGRNQKITINGMDTGDDVYFMAVTPETLDMFGFEWIEGDKNISTWGNKKVAISQNLAETYFGKEYPIGQKLMNRSQEYEIAGIFKTWPQHSNFHFHIISLLEMENDWNISAFYTYAMLREGIDREAFIRKVTTDSIRPSEHHHPRVFDIWTPVQEMRYTHPDADLNVRLEDVRLFTMAAILLVICTLLNYLTLFVNRIQSKGRMMALRTVCGSSSWQMSCMLMTEYLLLMFGSLMVSMLFIEIASFSFIDLAQVEATRFQIYEDCAWLIVFIIILSALLSFLPVFYYRKKTLLAQIRPVSPHTRKGYFSFGSICIQLIISILFMFCSTVMMKQIHYLIHSDIGIERKQIGCVISSIPPEQAETLLKQIPCIKEVLRVRDLLYPLGVGGTYSSAKKWTGQPADAAPVNYQMINLNDTIALFYGLKMKDGPASFDLDNAGKEIFINETMARKLNIENPVGKMLDGAKIKGVIFDFQSQNPTKPVENIVFHGYYYNRDNLAFKYEGTFEECEKAIIQAFPEDITYLQIKDGEKSYREYIKSEDNLMILLGSITVVSLIIALFGIYALIVQSCERCRKEIAIRKVNGAQITHILTMFIKQYMSQVIIASIIAFPFGYALMKQWIEYYTLQTEISIWIFISIFISVTLLVTLCIGYRVWKAVSENPADVVKSE